MPNKLVVVLLAHRSDHENMGRALHALMFAKQAHGAGVDTELIFDGGGVEWAADMPNNEHFEEMYNELVDAGVIKGVCQFCAGAFEVEDELKQRGANMMDEDNGHPNIGKKIAAGEQVITL